MRIALQQARLALDANEVPIGAVLVCKGQVIGKAFNQVELLRDVTAHAEMMVITGATANLGGKYLQDCVLYVTLEPCIMCLGAAGHAHIRKIVYGAKDTFHAHDYDIAKLDHTIEVIGGMLADEAQVLLKEFFEAKRQF